MSAKRANIDDEIDDLEKVDIAVLKIDQSTQDIIVNGHADDIDRSRADFGVIIALIKAGCTDAQIRWIFTEYPVGQKSDEHQDKYGYLETSIDNAYEAVADEIEELAITDRKGARFNFLMSLSLMSSSDHWLIMLVVISGPCLKGLETE